ncbi:MMPL family transporter [Paenibacillus luteus]|uniref:MMPL family transporter n=1 Tax=Paenibacillus luteus TaxID=2545753 RepID=UPI001142A102|nr:MMPL family transporter [Paenibacillus luteus]
MAKYLYRLGRWAYTAKIKVIVGTLLVLLLLGVGALSMGISFTGEMTIPGTKSEQAGEILKKEFSVEGSVSGGQALLIFKAPKGQTLESEDTAKQIQDLLKKAAEDRAVDKVISPYNNASLNVTGEIGYAAVVYKVPASEVSEQSKEHVMEIIEATRQHGIQTELAGDVAFSELEIMSAMEAVGVVIAFIILALTLTSFLAAGMPILTAIVGLGIGVMCILIGSNFVDMSAVSITLAVMLGLAVGIDYALFILARYRQQLADGYSVQESIAIANATAGSSVVFAGLTVVIALCGLAVVQIPFLTMMGLAAAVCVFVSIIIAILFVPAMLAVAGERIGPARRNKIFRVFNKTEKKSGWLDKWSSFVTRRPIAITFVGIAVLLFISIPFFHMQLGLPDNGLKSEETTERRGFDLLKEAYGPGYHSPLIIVAQAEGANDKQAAINETAKRLGKLDNVASVTPAYLSPSGHAAMLTVTPKTGPHDSETGELVHQIRELSLKTQKENQVELLVTGAAAVNIDISEKLSDALPQFALVIVVLALILLTMVFRSVLVPIKAVLGFLLSLGATLGFVVFVLQDGYLNGLFGIPEPGPVLNFLPVIVVGILFGLAMDYEVFLVSRMREEYARTGDAKKAVTAGIRGSGAVVTAAGLIMIAVFAGFIFAEDPIIKSMGLALAFGVLFDAFVVRLAVVPAVMTLLGRAAWYLPKWLDRILPNIDVEGEGIMHQVKPVVEKVKGDETLGVKESTVNV